MAIDPITAGLNFVSKIADKIWPDPASKAAGLLELEKLRQTGELAVLAAETDLAKGQQEINKIEAANENLFVSGWRPAIGWTCAAAFAYHFVLQPLIAFLIANTGHSVSLPVFDMDALYTVLMGMLGLGGMRTAEKIKGTK